MNRSRLKYSFTLMLIIILGLASRAQGLPTWVHLYVGDALYAVMFYLVLAIFRPKSKPWRLLVLSLVICYAIELSQLIQTPWLMELRQNKLFSLIFGKGFLFSDIIAYTFGATGMFCTETMSEKY